MRKVLAFLALCFALAALGEAALHRSTASTTPPATPSHRLGLSFPSADPFTFRNKYFRYASLDFSGFSPTNGQPKWNISRQSVDWRRTKKGPALRPVRDQGQCGSDWAFATVAAIEAAVAIARGGSAFRVPSLSPQQFLDCVDDRTLNCTSGGNPADALVYAATVSTNGQGGLQPDANYPYAGPYKHNTACKRKGVYQVIGFEQVSFYGSLGLILALQIQPVIVNLQGSDPTFQSYKGGVFSSPSCFSSGLADHSVLFIGYNLSAPVPYWLLQNSWGTGWGEKGTMRLAMATGGQGTCGELSSPALFPVVPPPSSCGGINTCGSGTCVPNPSGHGASTCVCPAGFASAKNVDGVTSTCVPVDPCSFAPSNPCNLGTCVSHRVVNDSEAYRYHCLCPVGSSSVTWLDGAPTCVQPDEAMTYVPPTNYTVQPFDDCYIIWTAFDVGQTQFEAQNPTLNCSAPLTLGEVVNVTVPADDKGRAVSYAINKGDTCAGIARLFSLPSLLELNPGLNCHHLIPGQLVCVKDGNPPKTVFACNTQYTVRAGDTCRSIWTRARLSPVQFFSANVGLYCSNLRRGQQICVKGRPWPISCSRRYFARRGDSCLSILFRVYRGSFLRFKKLNSGFSCSAVTIYVGRPFCLN